MCLLVANESPHVHVWSSVQSSDRFVVIRVHPWLIMLFRFRSLTFRLPRRPSSPSSLRPSALLAARLRAGRFLARLGRMLLHELLPPGDQLLVLARHPFVELEILERIREFLPPQE